MEIEPREHKNGLESLSFVLYFGGIKGLPKTQRAAGNEGRKSITTKCEPFFLLVYLASPSSLGHEHKSLFGVIGRIVHKIGTLGALEVAHTHT